MMIRDLKPEDEAGTQVAAGIAQAAFSSVPYLESPGEAMTEVREAVESGRICLAAYAESGQMLGWIGGKPAYSRVWELHPLAVHPERQRQGVGRALVEMLEKRIIAAGGLTIILGTDDELGDTNLFGRDLYPDILGHGQRLAAVADHPFLFYQKLGFVVSGIVPDANGRGLHDIQMCKRVGEG